MFKRCLKENTALVREESYSYLESDYFSIFKILK